MRRVLLGLALFFALDSAVFRSGLYRAWVTPASMQGFASHLFQALEEHPAKPTRDVLVLGDSRIGEGFSSRRANALAGPDGPVFLPGGIPGTTPRAWCLMLERLDPDARRYAAIILGLRSFRQSPEHVAITDDRMLDADILGPLISTRAFIDLIDHQPGFANKITLWSRLLVTARMYRADFADLVARPRGHLTPALAWPAAGLGYADGYDGRAGTMVGLAWHPEDESLTFPDGLTEAQKATLREDFPAHHPETVAAEDAYNAYWIGRIARRYAGGPTKLILARLPTSPLPEVAHESASPPARFVTDVTGLPSVTLAPEEALTDLEKPALFFDGRHLNAEGRAILTERLVTLARDALSLR